MLQVGSILDGKYKILSLVGQGGTSNIWLAINERLNLTVAVKEYHFFDSRSYQYWKTQYLSEVNTLKELRHSGLPIIYDIIIQDDSPIIVMSYIQGEPLSNVLTAQGCISENHVIGWAKQLCDILMYLHSQTPPIIYRDLKPSNIMLQPSGQLALIDFGTSMVQSSGDTISLGTRGYAAPEQYNSDPSTLDIRIDIYALGVTLHHLLTGKDPALPPYDLTPIRMINPELSKGLEQIIIKCTALDPDQRYQSVKELMSDLYSYQEDNSSISRNNLFTLVKQLFHRLRKLFTKESQSTRPHSQVSTTHVTHSTDLISYNVDILMTLYDNKE